MHTRTRVVAGQLPVCRTFCAPPVAVKTASRTASRRASKVEVKAATLTDLSSDRTELRSFVDCASEDTLEHPSQLPDDRQTLQGCVKGTQASPSSQDSTSIQAQLYVYCSCESVRAPLDVAVLLSGGVDSSFALHLLKRAGHNVQAFYLQIWFQEDFRNYWDSCPWEEDLSYCQQVCKDAGVELHVVPLTDEYWDRVVAHSIAEIKAGRTPNPDILCNSRVKFGAFYEYLASHQDHKFDRIASGHYARIIRGEDPVEPVRLALAPDAVKDQTYFLAHLTQAQLSRVMFPLGSLNKGEVRALAKAAGLPNQARRDSQGICFLGKVKFSEFVEQHLGVWPGCIIEEETGEVLGYHQGFWFHTVGQRRGIPLNGGPWYVTQKDVHTNTVYVSRNYYSVDKERNLFTCDSINWITGPPDLASQVLCKVRHGPVLYKCDVSFTNADQSGVAVRLECNDQGLASGQYAVFYQDGICLGSGVIQTTGVSHAEVGSSVDDQTNALL